MIIQRDQMDTGQVCVIHVDDSIKGVAILKNDEDEWQWCVVDAMQGKRETGTSLWLEWALDEIEVIAARWNGDTND